MSDSTAEEDLSLGLAKVIRSDSAKCRLTPCSRLCELFPETDIRAVIGDSGAEDLKLMEGKAETYFFSSLSMTEAYALHLFRVDEKNPVKLIADTVRDESRIYPRPTDIRIFLDTPFSLKPNEIDELLGRLEIHPDGLDIKSYCSSTGAKYLYSTKYLAPAHAESLAEWIEVGQKDNP
jgi:hypothetical protein